VLEVLQYSFQCAWLYCTQVSRFIAPSGRPIVAFTCRLAVETDSQMCRRDVFEMHWRVDEAVPRSNCSEIFF
jgi:hypothetical protein